ncbi:MAG: Holliday junction DNA helicase RuvA [Alphaproteobacteria bacterium]|jgi:Holliday junction DNA helicase RuvA
MIAALNGLIDSIGEDSVIVDVGGVGYLVFCSSRTLAALPRVGEAVSLRIDTHVREDHIHLYGFSTEAERAWFRLLTTVQGVGVRVALAIQSALAPTDLARAIAAGDKPALGRASGVGPKLAARIATELKDKAGALELGMGAHLPDKGGAKGQASDVGDEQRVSDAVSALVNLGYGRTEAYGAVIEAVREMGEDSPLQALIRGGLTRLGAAA